MKCPKCDFENPEGMNFCGNCAHDLKKVVETHSKSYNKPESYTPKHLADKILKSKSSIVGEKKFVTVLFADVANYTSMSEKLDPEAVHQIMDGTFKILMDEIHGHKGTINQFTGDGVMALFGAPLALEDHAQDACRAALAIQISIKAYSKVLETKYNISFQMRIGINSGSVVVGSIGDDLRMDYTAIGDTTNLAARMESLAQPGTILISPNTHKKVHQQFDLKPLGETEVKGKEELLEVYELVKDKIHRPRLGRERKIYSEMVGRTKELNKLELQVNKAIDGDGSVVNIIGEAGIGKSRLISELRNSPTIKKVTLLEGRAISIGRNLSFHPIIDLFKHWARISEDDTEVSSLAKLEAAIRSVSQRDADEIIPFVATLMGMKLTGRYAERINGVEGEALEKLILKNVKDLITRSTELTPLVIVTEDLHWADTSSIELLESLFRLAETQRILFINVFRPGHKETGERIIQTIKENLSVYYVEINIEPLNEQMSETLINNMLNITGLHYGIKNKIVQRAGGNPFFIEEVVRSFIDEGAVVVKNGNFEVTDKIETMIIPHTINDVLMARIDRLEDETRDLVKVASVIGRNFFHRILSEVAKSVQDIDNRLSHLKEIQLIRERKRMEELEYLFKHALAQEAAYESVLHQKRKELHLQVAKSIESVFKERLHEFYGMLALHYSKAEDYANAEHYLVKAGEEAIRSSASNEALNYYQEGLKLYLQHSKDVKDPEKLAMFEKNIAIALFNKSRWVEALEHIDKVLQNWNIVSPNRIFTLLKFIKNIISIMSGLNRLLEKRKPSPNQRDNEVFDLFYKRASTLFFFDNYQFLFSMLNAFNRTYKFNFAKSPEATNIILGTSGMFTVVGLFKLSKKLLEIGHAKMDTNNIKNLMTYITMDTATNCFKGNWEKIGPFDEAIFDGALKAGEFWNTINTLWTFAFIDAEKGNLVASERKIKKASDIAKNYNYDYATVIECILKSDLMLKKGRLSEAQLEAELGISLSRKLGSEMHQLMLLGFRAESSILLNNEEKAKDSIQQATEIVNQQKFSVPPHHAASYFVARFLVDIQLLKNFIAYNDNSNKLNFMRKTYKSGMEALRTLRKYAPHRTKTLRLMGDYHSLIGKQNKAFKWWDKAAKKGEELGARPDLSRTYFEIGRALLDPKCNYKEWNGMLAQEYLDKARTMFQEMDLQYDLDELEKIAASN
jgi:class 3 adenylate cyclase